uniref:Uncharacterized protein n=2 Tax=Nicotiana TaxID=4085 RepID=A0A1S3XWT2_TOBAC|nr:PREDICTED: uncharacterized protein LOC104221063 [Nicotiana sylvestris]XP_016444335.1 PREDICTED: uncharacterized protein LOC107769614 [Nicotiana tabacum]
MFLRSYPKLYRFVSVELPFIGAKTSSSLSLNQTSIDAAAAAVPRCYSSPWPAASAFFFVNQTNPIAAASTQSENEIQTISFVRVSDGVVKNSPYEFIVDRSLLSFISGTQLTRWLL